MKRIVYPRTVVNSSIDVDTGLKYDVSDVNPDYWTIDNYDVFTALVEDAISELGLEVESGKNYGLGYHWYILTNGVKLTASDLAKKMLRGLKDGSIKDIPRYITDYIQSDVEKELTRLADKAGLEYDVSDSNPERWYIDSDRFIELMEDAISELGLEVEDRRDWRNMGGDTVRDYTFTNGVKLMSYDVETALLYGLRRNSIKNIPRYIKNYIKKYIKQELK